MNDTILLTRSPAQFTELVGTAFKLRREGHVIALAASPLAQSALVDAGFLSGEPVSADARGRSLQSLLRWGVDKLRPGGQHSWTALNWRPYNVLRGFYIQGLRVAELSERMAIADQTLYKIRPSAIAAAAAVLRQELRHPQFAQERKNYALADRYQSCSPPEQLLLRIAVIFERPVSYRWLHHLAQQRQKKTKDIQPHLHNLSQEQLLLSSRAGSDFLVHPDMRSYLLLQLKFGERQLWHREAGRLYRDEKRAFLAAVHHLRQGREFEAAAQIIMFHYQEIVDNLEVDELAELLAKFRRAELKTVDHWATLNIIAGRVAEWQGKLDVALEKYREGLQARNIAIKAEAFYHRGKAFENLDTDEAQVHYQQGIELLERADVHNPLLVTIYIHRAWIFIQNRPDLERAAIDLQRAQQAVQYSDRENRADLYNAWGELEFRRDKLAQATAYRLQAWMIANELQDVERMLKFEYNLGLDYAYQNQYDKALSHFKNGKTLAVKSGNQNTTGAYNKGIGQCYYFMGEYQEAIHYGLLAYHNFVETDSQKHQSHTCHDLAEAYGMSGDIESGRRYFMIGLQFAQLLEDELLVQDFKRLEREHPTLNLYSDLNERQKAAIDYVKQHKSIANRRYRDLTEISQKQAVRDLRELVKRQIFVKVGDGRATRYEMCAPDWE
ncbi:MAG TPA: tetratricopeptide repeat protein [Thermoflexia bacterium]|nr:tetratricopeptide repeat protein [Thermoflexia bacterium]